MFPVAGGDRGGNLLDDRGGYREGGTASGEDFSREVADLMEISRKAREMEERRKRIRAISDEIKRNNYEKHLIQEETWRRR